MEKIRSRAHKKEHDYVYDNFFKQGALFIQGHYFSNDQVDGQKYGNQCKRILQICFFKLTIEPFSKEVPQVNGSAHLYGNTG